MNSTDWTPAIAILAAGLILGLLFIYVIRRRKGATFSVPLRSELEAKRDLLLRQIGEIEEGEQRTSLEIEAADVLRELDGMPANPPDRVRVAFLSGHPVLKGYVLGLASAIVIGLLGYYGSTFARPREVASSMPTAGAASSQPESASDVQLLEQAVANDPENIEHRIALAKACFARDDLNGVFAHTNAVLAKNPDEPRALTFNSIVLMSMGRLDEARQNLDRATKRDPKLLDAWVALASVHTQAGQNEAAAAAIETAIRQHPQQEKRLRDVLVEMRSQMRSQTTGQAAREVASDLPPGHPPMEIAPKGSPTNTGASAPIRITLSIGDSARLKSGVVYLIARADGGGSGHPIAVKRVKAESFPLSVDFGGSDSMMGQPLPARVRVEARLDSDGDAGTNDATDPKASADGVSAGSVLALILK